MAAKRVRMDENTDRCRHCEYIIIRSLPDPLWRHASNLNKFCKRNSGTTAEPMTPFEHRAYNQKRKELKLVK